MNPFQKMKTWLAGEAAKLKPMTGRERAEYIWDYYKISLSIALFLIVTVVSILCTLLSPQKIYLNNAHINLTSMEADCSSLTQQFHDAAKLSNYDEVVIRNFFISSTSEPTPDDTVVWQSLQVMLYAQELDLFFLPETTFRDIASMDIYTNIAELLPAQVWDSVKDYAVYITAEEGGEPFPAALNVTDCPAVKDCAFFADSVVVSFSPTTQRADNCVEMIKYLFSLEQG